MLTLISIQPPYIQMQGMICIQEDYIVGPVVKVYASKAADFRLRRGDISGSSHTSDFKVDTPVATLPGAWRNRVSAGTDRPDVRVL